MKEALSSFDVLAAVAELQPLVGGRVDKVYHPALKHLVLSIRTPGEDKAFIHFYVGSWLYKSNTFAEAPQVPSDFAMMLRKRIANARVTGIRQQGFDRIAVVSLEKDGEFQLVLELFGDGNVVLVKDGVIVQPLTSHTWKHRDVRAKRPFAFPPPVPDPTSMTSDELRKILQNSDTDVVRTIATKLNTGGRYAEEICARAGIDKTTQARDLDAGQADLMLRTILSLRGEIVASDVAFVVLKGAVIEDVVPTKLGIYEGLSHEGFDSFSAAVESYIARIPPPKEKRPRESVQELERIKRKLAQQEAAVMTLQDEARESHLLGDFIFANYEEVANIIAAAKAHLLASKDVKTVPGVAAYDRKTSMADVVVGFRKLRLNIKDSVEANAQRYYESAKRSRKKLEGLLVALDDARKSLEERVDEQRAEEGVRGSKHEPTKKFWFERFRWFISSEGAVVLGGKDARTNDMLVKKHLDAGDRYAHADFHGAPSVVVKMKEGVTEITLKEACEFAVATSRAWNAKIGSAAGYWVLPEQVSKTPQSGEYLARGAFVIRGKRNYSGKLEIRLGVGEIEFEGSRKIMCGPDAAIRARSKRYVIIRPGDKDKNAVAKQLSDAFEVPIEEIQSIMPPGDVEIVERVGMSIS